MSELSFLHHKTPLIYSSKLTQLFGKGPVYLKLENLQPSGSFKIRGMGATCQSAKAAGATKLVGSSGGNAGMAMAYAAKKIGMPIVLFIPTSTPAMMVERIKAEGADVRVAGSNWDAANAEAIRFVDNDPGAFLVHPFDQQTCWDGHSSIMSEIRDQLRDDFGEKRKPSALISCVGGGGLAVGLLLGLEKVDWCHVPVILTETVGADCFNAALSAGLLVTLDSISSVAKSLGALTVCEKLFDLATSPDKKFEVISRVVTDKDAIRACLSFADDHRMMVEPACGAALSVLYFGNRLNLDGVSEDGPVVAVVCGGNLVTIDLIDSWRQQFNLL